MVDADRVRLERAAMAAVEMLGAVALPTAAAREAAPALRGVALGWLKEFVRLVRRPPRVPEVAPIALPLQAGKGQGAVTDCAH